jgi:hypothetical protein
VEGLPVRDLKHRYMHDGHGAIVTVSAAGLDARILRIAVARDGRFTLAIRHLHGS